MKKPLPLTAIGLFLLLLFQPLQAAAGDSSAIKFFDTMELIGKPRTEWGYLEGAVAPLGWSADGKFAYVEEIINEAADRIETGFLRWIVQDMVTDKILWDTRDRFEELPDKLIEGLPDKLEGADLNEIYQWELANIKTYQAMLEKYKIVLKPDLRIEKFPLVYQGAEYRGLISDLERGKDKYSFEETVLKYRVLLAKGDRVKAVGEFKPAGGILDVHVGGYGKSPYEPRVAIAICTIRRGWEGPPHPVGCFFAGCHLEKGFDAGIPKWADPVFR